MENTIINEILIMDTALEKVRNLGNVWRINYSIGFRNGDVHGGCFEDKNLLFDDKQSKIKRLINMETKKSMAEALVELEEEIKILKNNPIIKEEDKKC